MREASALTKVLNLTSNVMALANFLLNGTVYYGLGLAAAVFCIAGHYIGSGLVVSNGQKNCPSADPGGAGYFICKDFNGNLIIMYISIKGEFL